jgi:tetratricopeptide (TPR) repeat protein
MQSPPARRLGLVRQPRFLDLNLLERLLEESHAGQLADPARAAELARVAARLASLIEEGKEEATAALARAWCLGANARRLEGRPRSAEALLAKAAPYLYCRLERAFYCRTLALLRWEQGRGDEAMAMFQHAACLYVSDDLNREVGGCLALLGLVLQEEGDEGEALSLLSRGWAEMDREVRPLFAVRAGLALADCLAQVEQTERARHVLLEAWQLFGEVTDPREMVRVHWLEGRVLCGLGEREEALHVLESVRRQLLAEPSPAEAALVSLDLALALAESGRAEEIEALAEALRATFPDTPAMSPAAEVVRALARPAVSEHRLGEAARATAGLRRLFRKHGPPLKPLPFA